jgi:predicted membrane protein
MTAVVFSEAANLISGMPYPGLSIILWNGGVDLCLFVIVITLLRLLSSQMKKLESTVEARTQDLFEQMSERGRLERELMEHSEREHKRVGKELPDYRSS